jgi:endonuclease/exonuclease/phosphatase (EEP) superfamily protein YafD
MPRLRDAQARYVAGILAGERLPTILGGDLNAVPGTPTVRSLQSRLVDTWPLVGSGPDGTAGDGARIDYVLATPPLAPRSARVLPSAISDHARVVVDLVVPADCPDPDGEG